uniref:Uncharacterized protein n=1 Tax=Opuntia streptacantha TaxID=393608 RepID=A0A7C9DZE2_OPUST
MALWILSLQPSQCHGTLSTTVVTGDSFSLGLSFSDFWPLSFLSSFLGRGERISTRLLIFFSTSVRSSDGSTLAAATIFALHSPSNSTVLTPGKRRIALRIFLQQPSQCRLVLKTISISLPPMFPSFLFFSPPPPSALP